MTLFMLQTSEFKTHTNATCRCLLRF